MARDPGPVWVEYDCRGKRGRKWFESGMGRAARAFYAAKYKAGRNPRVVRDDGGLYPRPVPPAAAAGALLRDCQVAAEPGRVTITLPNGSALVLSADDLERLAFLVRDEPDPGDCVYGPPA